MPRELDTSLNPSNLKKPLVGAGLMFLYVLSLETLGFIVATSILNAVLLVIFRVRKVHMIVLYPVLLSVAVFLVFRKFLMIELPEGIFHL